MDEAQKKFNERAWYLIAFIAWLLLVFSAIGWKEDNSRCSNDPSAVCPDEWELRGGDIW